MLHVLALAVVICLGGPLVLGLLACMGLFVWLYWQELLPLFLLFAISGSITWAIYELGWLHP